MKYLLFLILITSCTTIQKAEKKLDSNPTESARYCSVRFAKDSIVVKTDTIVTTQPYEYSSILDSIHNSAYNLKKQLDTAHQMQDNLMVYDLLNQQATIHNLLAQVDILKKTFKPCKDTTIYSVKTNTIVNTSREKYLEGLNASQQEKIGGLTKGRNTWRWIGLASDLFLLLIIAFLIYGNVRKL